SAAAEAACESVTGRRLRVNRWKFWQHQGGDGTTFTLADAGKHLARSRSKFVGGEEEVKAIREALEAQSRRSQQDQSERRRLRLKFWEGLLSRPQVKTTRHANLSPAECGWIAAGSGARGLPFVHTIKQQACRVELFIDRGAGKAETNKRIFET